VEKTAEVIESETKVIQKAEKRYGNVRNCGVGRGTPGLDARRVQKVKAGVFGKTARKYAKVRETVRLCRRSRRGCLGRPRESARNRP